MSLEVSLLCLVVVGMVYCFLTERLPVDLTALLGLAVMVAAGSISPGEAFGGFSSPAVITMVAIFFISGALRLTGVAEFIGFYIYRLAGKSEAKTVALVMVAAALLSSVMNNVVAAAILLPAVIALSQHAAVPAPRLLIPLAFGTILGGMLTAIGTPANIIASEILVAQGIPALAFTEFTPFGIIAAALGITYMALCGRHLLPADGAPGDEGWIKSSLAKLYKIYEQAFALAIPAQSGLHGLTLGRLHFGERLRAQVIGIVRRGQQIFTPRASEPLERGDRLIVGGKLEDLVEIRRLAGVTISNIARQPWSEHETIGQQELDADPQGGATRYRFVLTIPADSAIVGTTVAESRIEPVLGVTIVQLRRGGAGIPAEPNLAFAAGDLLEVYGEPDQAGHILSLCSLAVDAEGVEFDLESPEICVVEALLSPRSKFIGSTLAQVNFREKYDFQVLALWRRGQPIRVGLSSIELEFGDALLLQGPRHKIALIAQDPEFVLLSQAVPKLTRRSRAPAAVAALLLMVVLSACGAMSVHFAAALAALVAVVGGAITMEECYRETEWKLVVFVGALLPFGAMFDRLQIFSGIGSVFSEIGLRSGPVALVICLLIMSSVISQMLDGVIAVVLMSPVALKVAAQIGSDPRGMVMAVALGSSLAYAFPFSSKSNLLVMGVGGYKSKDYFWVGTATTVICFLSSLLILLWKYRF